MTSLRCNGLDKEAANSFTAEPDRIVFWRSLVGSPALYEPSSGPDTQTDPLAQLTLTSSLNEGAQDALVGQMPVVLDSGRHGICAPACEAQVDDFVFAAPVFQRVMVLRPAAEELGRGTKQSGAETDQDSVADMASESRGADAQELPCHTGAQRHVGAILTRYLFVDHIDMIGPYADRLAVPGHDSEADVLVEERITLI